VCQNGAFHGLAVDHAHVLVCKEVQAVKVALQRVDEQILCGLLHVHDSLEHDAGTFLNELTHGVQVGGEDAACGEQPLVVLALALAEQLLVPLVHQGEVRLVALQNLHSLALAVQDVADGGVLISIVVGAQHGEALHSIGSALHQSVNVDAGSGDGQQTHGAQHGVAAAHVIGNYEGGPALCVSQLLQGALGTVGGGVDALVGFLHAHLLFQQFTQHTEGQRGLGGGAGLGDDVDGEALALAQADDVVQVGGADAVAAEVDLQTIFQLVVVHTLNGFHNSACAQIAAADAGHDQNVRVLADLGSGCLDAGELFLVIIPGQGHPAQKIAAGAILGFQLLVGGFYLRVDGCIFLFADEAGEVFRVQCDTHFIKTSKRSAGPLPCEEISWYKCTVPSG